MRRPLPLVELRGSPSEVGLEHGRAARAAIAHNVRTYLSRFFQEGRIDRDEARRRAAAYLSVIERANPAYAEEMRGIAEGSRQDLLDVVAVNVRYEIMYSEFVRKGLEQRLARAGGCTSFALLPRTTTNGHVLIGQNWDWIPEVRGLVVRARRRGLPESLGFTEAGIAGAKFGLNAAGIGLVINGLVSDQDTWSRLENPFHVRCYEVLASRNLDEALRVVLATKRSCSSNFLIVQAGPKPKAVDIEAAPEHERLLEPGNGYLAHTNHFSEPESLGIEQPLADDRPSTFTRLDRIQELLGSRMVGNRSVALSDLQEILKDHANAPFSLCRHEDPARSANEQFLTVVSSVMDVDAREMWIVGGNPCEGRYRRYHLAA